MTDCHICIAALVENAPCAASVTCNCDGDNLTQLRLSDNHLLFDLCYLPPVFHYLPSLQSPAGTVVLTRQYLNLYCAPTG